MKRNKSINGRKEVYLHEVPKKGKSAKSYLFKVPFDIRYRFSNTPGIAKGLGSNMCVRWRIMMEIDFEMFIHAWGY